MKNFYIREFKELDSKISLTADCWSSISNNSYIGVTAHFVNKNWKLTKRILALKYLDERKTANDLYEALVEILNEYQIKDKIYAITTDSGSDIRAAVRKFNFDFNLPCACHRLNLSVNDIFKIKKIKLDEKKSNVFS